MLEILHLDVPGKQYPIVIGPNPWADLSASLCRLPKSQVLIVTNQTIAPLHLNQVQAWWQAKGLQVAVCILPDGEQYKDWQHLQLIFDALIQARFERGAWICALGGGVVGDMAGFAAACYMRGIPFVQVPTTLLSQVDSSVGGKTGINHPEGKNMLGAFHQPEWVVIDLDFLRTLPDREYVSGLAEVIKYGLIMDTAFYHWILEHTEALLQRETSALRYAIKHSCACKAVVVNEDERETGRRALLNLGHTFGHAIETAVGYGAWLHGEAVAVGMLLALETSLALGAISEAEVQAYAAWLLAVGLPSQAPNLGVSRWLELMAHDKKAAQGQIRFVLLRALGDAWVTAEVPAEVLQAVLTGRWIAV